MTSTPTSNSQIPQSLEMQKLIAGFANAISQFTPDGVAASGKALQDQLQITQDMQNQWDHARADIAQAEQSQANLAAMQTDINQQKETLATNLLDYQQRCQVLDNRITAFSTSVDALQDQQKQLDTYADQLTGREQAVSEREQAVLGRERAALVREQAVSNKEALIGNAVKQLANANS